MAFQVKQLVPCLLLLWITSFSHAKAKPSRCPDSGQGRRSNHTFNDGFEFYRLSDEYRFISRVDLNSLRNLSDSDANNTFVLSLLSTIDQGIELYHGSPEYEEASFSVTVAYQPLQSQSLSGLAFLIVPNLPVNVLGVYFPRDLSNRASGSAYVSGSTSVSVAIGVSTLRSESSYSPDRAMVVNITVDPGAPGAALASKYEVWIDFDHVGHRLSVYVDLEGKPKPDNTISEVQLSLSSVLNRYAQFGLLSTAAQMLGVGDHGWNVTVSDFPDDYIPDKGGWRTIVLSILGSLAAAALVAAAGGYYFNTRYRRWQRDLDELARSMERLPGVPTKVEFADIKKATGNFHETMKLGGGGFGAVYRCTLPAAASKTEQPMDVAIKRFTRDVQNRRYNDFLAEVSIINRLRHKNIVPLVGWSYNKGEPLLVFEYMTNGSLDQHLFSKGGGHDSSSATILRWATRYEIVRDIATGLHYVHHEYEPMVLHRDIKGSNVMLDSSFRARLGDFGIACTVAIDRNSATGVAGTWGYIAPEYAMCGKATRKTDIYALGVLILEVVTGQRALADHQVMDDDDIHITDRVWRFHREGSLTECVDAALIIPSSPEEDEQLYAGGEAERLLLLGLACSNPNPSDRPAMPDVMQVIAKSTPPPDVPSHKPRFMWPPREEGHLVGLYHDSAGTSSMMSYLDNSTMSTGEVRAKVCLGQPAVQACGARGYNSFQLDQPV